MAVNVVEQEVSGDARDETRTAGRAHGLKRELAPGAAGEEDLSACRRPAQVSPVGPARRENRSPSLPVHEGNGERPRPPSGTRSKTAMLPEGSMRSRMRPPAGWYSTCPIGYSRRVRPPTTWMTASSRPSASQSASRTSPRTSRGAPPERETVASVPDPNAPGTAAERDGHLAVRGDREHDALDAQVSRLAAAGAGREDAGRLAVPRGRVDDRGAVRGKAGAQDGAAAKRELRVGRRERWRAQVPGEQGPERDGGEERSRQDRGRPSRGRRPAGGAVAVDSPVAPATASRLRATSRADWKRSSGRFSRQRRTTRSRATETRPSIAGSSGGSSRRIAVSPRPACPPERPPPREHLVQHDAEGEDVGPRVDRPARAPAPATCRPTVPSDRCRARVICGDGLRPRAPPSGSRCSLARPKSRILTRPSRVTNRFSGFRSRWTIPRSCAAARPRAICTAYSTAFRGVSAPPAMRSRSVSPSSSSETTYGAPSCAPTS